MIERLDSPRKGLFRVRRTSLFYSDTPPCDGAKQYEVRIVDCRSTDDPKKVPAHKGTDAWWYSAGENHRIEDGMICRDMGWKYEWFIEIQDIMDFVRKIGRAHV